ncbi:alpha beta hydrolase [Diplodia corticola]|uniref:Alpha beta hydrolase n=1 Tax=Diplodia corticola TaxID=236234 RepID=A0A1J9RQJ0_9PEZI|nr:alpha beta hydrolase [Diplodia corticola]OJD30164.1 alpha beta hydrolase [Diplodia corticola]
MAPVPGLLYVTMQPHPELPDSVFHDWYNNEHGPTRLRLPFVANGYRYRAADLDGDAADADGRKGSKEKPEWVALYDIPDMNALNSEAYLSLRGPPLKSEREATTMKKIHVDRRVYDLMSDKKKEGYKELDDVDAEGKVGGVLVSVTAILKPGADEAEYKRWAEDEHVSLLSKVPGWRRSRRFKYSAVVKPLGPADEVKHTEYIALHEYDPENGLGTSPEFKAATTTPWTTKVNTDIVAEKKRRVYNLAYTFGPAPRYLSSLTAGAVPEFKHPDGTTKTIPASPDGTAPAAIESYITTPDGVRLDYRLDGGPTSSDHSPLLLLINSILTDHHIWDAFVASFLSDPTNSHYRTLRFNSRGRTSACGESPVTVDSLAADAVALLDALRVPRAASVVGVSLGGVTALAAALRHPARVASFVSCDTNPTAPAANPQLWADRIAVAEAEGATTATTTDNENEPIVGTRLAEATARRWFVPQSYDDAALRPRLDAVEAAVARNSLHGFKTAVQALYSYDYAGEMRRAGAVPGAFLVGAGDGKLPEGMRRMAEAYGADVEGSGGKKAPFYLVPDAGHLPMVEKPEVVKGCVTEFLRGLGM